MKKNKLIFVLLLLICMIVVGAVMIAKNQEGNDVANPSASSGKTSFFDFGGGGAIEEVSVDADNAEHTLSNIARDSATIKEQFREYQQDSDETDKRFRDFDRVLSEMQKRNELLERQISTQAEVITELREQEKTVDVDSLRSALFSDIQSELSSFVKPDKSGDDYQVNEAAKEQPVEEDEGVTRIRSLNMRLDKTGEPDIEGYKKLQGSVDSNISSVANNLTSGSSASDLKKPEFVVDPRYTVFANSILNNAVTVTHLVGRVPVDGDVGDAAPFKVLVGNDNLQANGFRIPNLKGMLMSGSVFGDALLKCVRTKITSATYIFEDGRGITFPTKGGGEGTSNILGYLTDDYGNPCIKGAYYTNRNEQLKKTFAAGLASGAASAFASAETTQETDSDGNTVLNVTGDKLKYLAGVGIAQGTKDVVAKLENEFDIWDTVVVQSGMRVAVHLQRTLELDQTTLQRRVEYVQTNSFDSFTD